ncbi:MAG TPA: group 1 truncated hemoglobin [Vicinamibacteria bacterium]|nr:group 1 truncated hemoglobin [Vicinamibacteria bacterium]
MTRGSVVATATLFGVLAASPAAAQGAAKPLYDRLGGAYNIAAVVDAFIERLRVNPTLNANPAIAAARKPERLPGLKFHLTAQVCQVTGGPCQYVGRSMKEAHATLNISEKEWDAMVADFTATLTRFGVPAAEQQELVDIVATTRPDIVVAGR